MSKSHKTSTRSAAAGKKRRSAKSVSGNNKAEKSGTKGKRGKAPKSDKIASMTVMLCRMKGASIEDLCKMTGWQRHSVRAAISGTIKKKLGLDVRSEKVGGVRIYRVIV